MRPCYCPAAWHEHEPVKPCWQYAPACPAIPHLRLVPCGVFLHLLQNNVLGLFHGNQAVGHGFHTQPQLLLLLRQRLLLQLDLLQGFLPRHGTEEIPRSVVSRAKMSVKVCRMLCVCMATPVISSRAARICR